MFDNIGKIAGMKCVSVIQRLAQWSHGQLRRMTSMGEYFRWTDSIGVKIFRYANSHINQFAATASDRNVILVQIDVASHKSADNAVRRNPNGGLRRFKGSRDDDLISQVFDRRKVCLSGKPGAGAVLFIFVPRETRIRIHARRRLQGVERNRYLPAIFRVLGISIVWPQAVNDKPQA